MTRVRHAGGIRRPPMTDNKSRSIRRGTSIGTVSREREREKRKENRRRGAITGRCVRRRILGFPR